VWDQLIDDTDFPEAKKEAERQGLPLVHFSPQPEPFLSLKLSNTPNVSPKKCSRQVLKWTIGRGFHSSTS